MKPMNAQAITQKKLLEVMEDKRYIIQEKFTGIRALIYKTPSNFSIITRGGHNITRLLPHLQCLNNFNFNGLIFDCELCASGLDDAQVAGLLNPHRVKAHEIDISIIEAKIFDVINTTDVYPLYQRLLILNGLRHMFPNIFNNPINIVDCIEGDKKQKQDFIDKINDARKEGVMFKNLNAYYMPNDRPGNNWYKLKRFNTFDCFITGYTAGKGKYSNMVGSIQISQLDKNHIISCIGTVSGFSDSIRYDFTINPDNYLYKVIEIAARERTKSGALKEPRFVRFRPDKHYLECFMEE